MGLTMMEINYKPYIEVSVGSPIMHLSWEDAQYTSYSISLKTNHCAFTLSKSTVRRRYSEFDHLRKLLRNQHPDLQAPSLPSKILFFSRFDDNFIEKRRFGLEEFLRKLFLETLYLSNRTVHLFVQSSLPMNKIQLIVEGKCAELNHCEPHLLFNQHSLSNSLNSDISLDSDVPDFHLCRVRSHSHVSQGARITLCSPALHVPKCEKHSQSFSVYEHSLDSDCCEMATSSPTSLPLLLPTVKFDLVLNHDETTSIPLNNNAPQKLETIKYFSDFNCQRTKKVSFSSEVSVVPDKVFS